MYASVASYMCQSWRRLDLHLRNWPRGPFVILLAAVIYLNFFTEHFIGYWRFLLMALVLLVFFPVSVQYTVATVKRRMPLVLSFILIGLFVWFAENISTFLHGWSYPYQQQGWTMVHAGKITSWFLLVIISFICVAYLKHWKALAKRTEDPIESYAGG